MYTKLALFFCLVFYNATLSSVDESSSVATENSKMGKEDLLDFRYEAKALKDVLNYFASKRAINIIYSEADPLTAQITFDAGRKVTLKTAWDLLMMLLDKAGFSLLPRGKDLYVLVANSALSSEQVPLYAGVHYSSLPDSVEKVRYMFYFSNVQLSSQQASIDAILKTIFPAATYSYNVVYDLTNNGIIFTGNSSLIKSAMLLIDTLDEPGYQEQIEMLPLKYASAADVVTIFNSLLQNNSSQRGYISKKSAVKQATYFDPGTKITNLDPNNIRKVNTVIVFGKKNEVEKVIDFIKNKIDVVQDDGQVFYHVVDLQYLSATTFATQLQTLVTQGASLGSGQSTGSLTSELAFNSQTKILAEAISTGSSQNTTSTSANVVKRGGNRLVIAANKRDWIRLDALIKQLDVPQKQVIIEALVLDLDIEFTRQLSAQIRSRGLAPTIFPKYMQAQAAMLGPSQMISTSPTDYTALLGNLSSLLGIGTASTVTGNSNQQIGQSTPSSAFQGSSVVTISGSGVDSQANSVWAFFQLLSQHNNVKVTTRPFLVARNNQASSITSTVKKKIAGSVTTGVNATVNMVDKDAPVTVSFTPLISDDNVINLQCSIDITYWNESTDAQSANQQFTRTVKNNVSIKNGDVLVLGGLTRSKTNRVKSGVPFLSRIPIVGHLFSGRTQYTTKDQLFVLMRPTIIEPRPQGGMGSITRAGVRLVGGEIAQAADAFSGLKDPISRWFFGENEIQSEEFNKTLSVMGTPLDYLTDSSSSKVVIEDFLDDSYRKKVKPIGSTTVEKSSAPVEEKTDEQKQQQAASNMLHYQLHEVENPYDKKSAQKKKRKRKKEKTDLLMA